MPASRLLQSMEVELYPSRQLMVTATSIALELDHPAYDCIHLALASDNGWRFVTADTRLRAKLERADNVRYRGLSVALTDPG